MADFIGSEVETDVSAVGLMEDETCLWSTMIPESKGHGVYPMSLFAAIADEYANCRLYPPVSPSISRTSPMK